MAFAPALKPFQDIFVQTYGHSVLFFRFEDGARRSHSADAIGAASRSDRIALWICLSVCFFRRFQSVFDCSLLAMHHLVENFCFSLCCLAGTDQATDVPPQHVNNSDNARTHFTVGNQPILTVFIPAGRSVANLRRILVAARKVHSRTDYSRLAEPILLEVQQREQEILEYLSLDMEPVASHVA